MPNTVRLHRVLRHRPSGCMARSWMPMPWQNGFRQTDFTGKVHQIDARVGGRFKMSFTNFTSGKSHSFGGEYLELVPHERLRYTDVFDDQMSPAKCV